jgi:hypothetical protein
MNEKINLNKEELSEGDSFFYILPRYYSENNSEHKTFHVFQYKWCNKYSESFNEDYMFDSYEKAYIKSLELIEKQGY